MIRGIGFDFGNVIGIFNTLDWLDFISKYRNNCRDPREIFSGSLLETVKEYDLGNVSDTEFYSRIRSAYRMSIPTKKELFDKLGSILYVDREMLGIVKNLRQDGIKTFLITNMNSFHAQYICQNYPEFFTSFDYCLISCEEGIAKPNPEAWVRPLDFLGLKSEECIFIDDSYTNVKVACQLGIKGWHYNITDDYFCQNGRLNEEREKLKNFLKMLDGQGLLYNNPILENK